MFAVESFTDELAAAAGVDPVEFRLRGLTDPRAIDVLKRAAEMIGWQAARRPIRGPSRELAVGRGFAYVRYKQAENYVAMAMEVAVDRATGKISVRRVTCAHDCGLVVNPDSLRNQIEGSILQTLSRDAARRSEVRPLARHQRRLGELSDSDVSRKCPPIEVALIDRPTCRLSARAKLHGACGRGARQRDFRCHRSPAADRSVHASRVKAALLRS